MPNNETFRVLHVDLATSKGRALDFGVKAEVLGGSGLAAALFEAFGDMNADWSDPVQPLIFAIGPLSGYFPLMSKTVCGFKSPYNNQYTESHAGGRLALSLRFAGYDALMITGRAKSLSVLATGTKRLDVYDVHYLKGHDVFATGKLLRRLGRKSAAGHRSIMRIGPAGENLSAFACINVDTYRHFGRLGSGAVMGAKNLKAISVNGDGNFVLPKGKEYPALYKEVYKLLTDTDMMRKYHDLGTPSNLIPLNEIKSLPWRNLQATTDPGIGGITGETFAEQLLLRQTACAGCPVGCIHIGLLRHQFAKDHEFLYRQVNYDYESIFAEGSMVGLTNASDVLALLDETEKVGLDVMSAGVALAWATEAMEKGLISEKETLTPLAFGNVHGYLTAARHLGEMPNDFYRVLASGTLKAAAVYGGADFACVLGQEMAGYATGSAFYAAEAHSFRHSHLDCGAYTYDQKNQDDNIEKTVKFLLDDEVTRVQLCCMVSCLFARSAYTPDRLREALASLGMRDVADNLDAASYTVRGKRMQLKYKTGFDPDKVIIPKRYLEVETWKGKVDPAYLDSLCKAFSSGLKKASEV
ncbi:MAG: aldehyde ferredoxin oxidoreductase N-terminal domain-containing protein [Desulfovibrionaceae bacterium]